jgi:hypothetical protein
MSAVANTALPNMLMASRLSAAGAGELSDAVIPGARDHARLRAQVLRRFQA